MHLNLWRSLVISVYLFVPSFVGFADVDWIHLRGVNYDAVSQEIDLANSWPDGGPPILWRTDLGQGFSGIIGVGKHIYTQYQTSSEQFVVCLDANTGEIRWRTLYGWAWDPGGDWPGPMATPTYSEGKLFFAGAYGKVGVLESSKGRKIWSMNIISEFGGRGTELGYACTPAVEKNKVYFPVGGVNAALVALNAENGKVIWKSGDDYATYASVLPITLNGKRQLVVFFQNRATGFDPETGDALWHHEWSEGFDEHIAWPLYEEPYLLLTSMLREAATCLRLTSSSDGTDVEIVWKKNILANGVISSVVVDGFIYGFDLHDLMPSEDRPAEGLFKCIELKSGDVRWETNATGHASVVTADGKLFLLNDSGDLIMISASPEGYVELGRTQIFEHGYCWTPPTIHGGRIYLRNHSEIVSLPLRSEEWMSPSIKVNLKVQQSAQVDPSVMRKRFVKQLTFFTPHYRDILNWYVLSLIGGFGLAALLVSAVALVSYRLLSIKLCATLRYLFVGIVVTFGLGASSLIYTYTGAITFTWPVALFIPYQTLLILSVLSSSDQKGRQRVLRVALLLFVVLCCLYYYICTQLLAVMGYGFIAGFVPGLLVAGPAAKKIAAARHLLTQFYWTCLSFSFYYLTSGLFTIWRTQL